MSRTCFQDSSITGTELTITLSPTAGPFTAERYRIGLPPLQLLPLQSTKPEPSSLTERIQELEPRIHEILRNQPIDFRPERTALLHKTISESRIADDTLTYLVSANWHSDAEAQNWYDAAVDIHSLFAASEETKDVKVELVSWQLTTPKGIDTVENNHPMVVVYDEEIRPHVHAILDDYPKVSDAWSTIDVIRVGYETRGDTPKPVTISIGVEWDLDRVDWVGAERRIEALLEEKGFGDVEVEFERGDGIWTGCYFD